MKITLLLLIQLLVYISGASANQDTLKSNNNIQDTIILQDSIRAAPKKAIKFERDTLLLTQEKGSLSISNPDSFQAPSEIGEGASASTVSADAGRTAGGLDVSQTGSAVYTVPIVLPPGINGVVPQIALSYNSQAGNGLAGYGWNISGVSMISRIPSTKYHDGSIKGVNFDGNDRFALDGQRLILKSGVYGGDGAVYQTENYSNLKITSRGSYTYGPLYFEIYYPDGSIAVYGYNSNSKTPNDYAINYIDNPLGIRINYSYLLSNNTLAISQISYGSKGTLAGINQVNFIYKTSQRKEQAYISGGKLFQG